MTQRIRRFLRLSAPSPQISDLDQSPGMPGTLLVGALLAFVFAAAIVAPSPAAAVCTPDPPMEGDNVTCTDEVSDGYDVSDADDLNISIEGNSVFDDSGAMPASDSAIRIGDETQIAIGEDSIINVIEADGNGIRGDNNNFVDNGGTININGVGGRGIKIENNTTGILPNGAVNGETGSIFANSDDSIAMETGTNSGVATSGLIELTGENTRGVSAGSREDLSAAANISNLGTINVGGDGGFGIIAGDNWIDGILDTDGIFTPQAGGIRNLQDPMRGVGGDINVTGDNAFGIFAGDAENEDGNHNSFVVNGTGAVISVTGTNSVGISVGGNDYLPTVGSPFGNVYTFQNQGLVSGGASAGPLIEIRNFVEGFQNRILNTDTGEIFADITNLGTADRGIAIRGSDGEDEISNLGDIRGVVDLGLGNDIYIHGVDATFQDTLAFGDGNNTFENQGLFDAVITFGQGDQTVENSGTLRSDITFGDGNDFFQQGTDAVMENDIAFGDGNNTFENAGTFNANARFGAGNDRVENTGTISTPLDLGDGIDVYVHGEDAVLGGALSFGAGSSFFDNQGVFESTLTFDESSQRVENDGTLRSDLNFGDGDDFYRHGVDAVMDNSIVFGNGNNTFENEGIFDSAVSFGDGDDSVDNSGTIMVDLDLGAGDDTYTHGADATFDNVLSFGEGDSTFVNDGDFDAVINFGSGPRSINNRGELSSALSFSAREDTVFNTGTIDGNLETGGRADFVANNGSITGFVDLGTGDDSYVQGVEGSASGMITGGDGDDAIFLTENASMPTQDFDLDNTEGFETIRLISDQFGSTVTGGWNLNGTENFTGLTEVLAGAVLRPNGPKTFAGDLTIGQNGTLVLDVDGVTVPLAVEGTTAPEGGGLRLEIADGAAPTEGAPVQVINAEGGLDGEFEIVEFITDPVDGVYFPLYEADAVLIAFDPSLAALARGDSQSSIARHLSAINAAGTGVGQFQSFIDVLYALNLSGTVNLNPILNSLSPEGFEAQTTVMAEAGRLVTNLLMDRPRECQEGQPNRFVGGKTILPCHARRFSPWVAGTGSFRTRDSFDNRPGYDANVGGIVFGIDARPIGDLDFTVALATQQASIDVDDFGDSEITMTDLAAHVSWTPGPARLQVAASWGHGFHETDRRIRADLVTGNDAFNHQSETDHDSDRATLAAEAGYLFEVGPAFIEPLVGIDWAWINQRTIDEDEAPLGLALTIPGREEEIGSVSAGIRLTADYQHEKYISDRLLWADGMWRPMLDIRWRQYLAGDERDFSSRFDGAPNTSDSFKITSEEDPGGIEVGLGLSFIPDLANRLQLDLRYDAYISENTLQHDLVGRIAFGF